MNNRLAKENLVNWLTLVCLAALITVSVLADATDHHALLITMAIACSWLGALLFADAGDQATKISELLIGSLLAAAGFFVLATTPIYLGKWTDALWLSGGVFLLALLFNAAFVLFAAGVSRPAAKLLLSTVIAALCATPLYLGYAVSDQSQMVIDTAIAMSPISYFAAIIEYDYLRNGWFYQHTPFGGLRYNSASASRLTCYYGITTFALAIVSVHTGNLTLRNLKK